MNVCALTLAFRLHLGSFLTTAFKNQRKNSNIPSLRASYQVHHPQWWATFNLPVTKADQVPPSVSKDQHGDQHDYMCPEKLGNNKRHIFNYGAHSTQHTDLPNATTRGSASSVSYLSANRRPVTKLPRRLNMQRNTEKQSRETRRSAERGGGARMQTGGKAGFRFRISAPLRPIRSSISRTAHQH